MPSPDTWRRECERSLARSRARRESPLLPRRGRRKAFWLGVAAVVFFYAVVILGALVAPHIH